MTEFVKKIFNFKSSLPIVLLILGLGLVIVCTFSPFDTDFPRLYKFLSTLGEIFLVSSLLSFLTSTIEYLGVFRNALIDVIYDSKFLKTRKDLEKIWLTVSKALFKSKFPNINNALLETIKKNYLPSDEVCYYSDYKNINDIKFDPDNKDYVIVKNDISFTLKVLDKRPFTFPMNNWICIDGDNYKNIEFKFLSVTVNGKPIEVINMGENIENNQVRFKHEIHLKGCTEYQIKQSIYKRYSLKHDNYIGFKAKWLVHNMTVQLFFPEDMDVLFVERGTSKSYNLVKKRDGYLEYEYKGLILQKQGYIMILNSKRN